MWLELAGFSQIDTSRRVEDAMREGSHRRFGCLFRGFGGSGRQLDLAGIITSALWTVPCGGRYASDMALFAREKETLPGSRLLLRHERATSRTMPLFRICESSNLPALLIHPFVCSFSRAHQRHHMRGG